MVLYDTFHYTVKRGLKQDHIPIKKYYSHGPSHLILIAAHIYKLKLH